AHPGRRSITVTISRLKADPAAHRIGAMIINVGGPAIPVLSDVLLARQAMGATGARFDLIGMDQRFSGRSTPLDCHWPANWLSRAIDPAHPGVAKGVNGPRREKALRSWARWAARHDSQYHLGTTAQQVVAAVYHVYRTAAHHPLHVGPYRVDDTIVPALLLDP